MTDVVAMDVDSVGPSTAVPERKNKAKGGGKRFEIKKWNAVAMWSWAICTDTCAICRNNLYEPSIEYQVLSSALPFLKTMSVALRLDIRKGMSPSLKRKTDIYFRVTFLVFSLEKIS